MFAFPKLGGIFAAIAARIPATVRTGVRHWQGAGGLAVPLLYCTAVILFCGDGPPPFSGHRLAFLSGAAGVRVDSVQRNAQGVTVTDASGHSAQVSWLLSPLCRASPATPRQPVRRLVTAVCFSCLLLL